MADILSRGDYLTCMCFTYNRCCSRFNFFITHIVYGCLIVTVFIICRPPITFESPHKGSVIQEVFPCHDVVIRILIPRPPLCPSSGLSLSLSVHEDATTWKRFPYYWPFVRGIHQSCEAFVCCLFNVNPLAKPKLTFCQLDHHEQTSVTFESKHKMFVHEN